MPVPAMHSDVAHELNGDVTGSDVNGNDLLEQLAIARKRTHELFAIVKPGSLYERPIAERHRIVFYIGHLEAFDWNLFRERVFGIESFHPDFDRLFAFGIDPVKGGLPTDQPSDWPSIARVREYVEKVRNTLDDELANAFTKSGRRTFDGFSFGHPAQRCYRASPDACRNAGLHVASVAARSKDCATRVAEFHRVFFAPSAAT